MCIDKCIETCANMCVEMCDQNVLSPEYGMHGGSGVHSGTNIQSDGTDGR